MPTYKHPGGHDNLLTSLQTALEADQEDRMQGIAYLHDEDLMEVIDATRPYEEAHTDVDHKKLARKKVVKRANTAVATLRRNLGMIWKALNAEITHNGLDPMYYADFGLSSDGTIPQKGGRQQWLQRGVKALEGYEELMTNGHMLSVSIEVLRQSYDVARSAHQEGERLKGQVQVAERKRRSLRKDTEDAYNLVVSRLRHALRRESAGHVRAVLRRYGATFTYAPGEEALAEAEAPEGMETESVDSGTASTGDATATASDSASSPVDSQHRNTTLATDFAQNGELHQNGAAVTE